MPVMLERWNDDKMDALDAKVDAVYSKVNALDTKVVALDTRVDALDTRVDDLAGRMEKGFMRVDAELREQRQEMKAGFERVADRLNRMQWLLFQFCGMMLAALIGLIATQL